MNANLLTNAAGREFVFKRNYARWLPDKKRRETWEESVGRYCDFIFSGETRGKTPERVKKSIKEYISSHRVMPSMRAFWSAGKAAKKNNASIYNCSALHIRTNTDFAEEMFLLMSSCGV